MIPSNYITADMIRKWELKSLKEAIGCELSLSDEFLKSNCSEELQTVLMPLLEKDRNFIIQDNINDCWELNIFGSSESDINIVTGEIETQLENPLEELSEPDNHVINGDLVYTRFEGISIEVNYEGLKQYINDYDLVK
tara:strand:+ start:1943 stop:2356 length:414 start_codon:yes stop_codon:yes gene_type:complete